MYCFWTVSVQQTLKLAIIFELLKTSALMLHISIPCGNSFSNTQKIYDLDL